MRCLRMTEAQVCWPYALLVTTWPMPLIEATPTSFSSFTSLKPPHIPPPPPRPPKKNFSLDLFRDIIIFCHNFTITLKWLTVNCEFMWKWLFTTYNQTIYQIMAKIVTNCLILEKKIKCNKINLYPTHF